MGKVFRRKMVRRRTARRRPFRRVRRIHRPIGSGPAAKRYFKLRSLQPIEIASSGSSSSTFIFDLPTGSTDWSSVASLFRWYRVNAIRLKFIPAVTQVNTPAESGDYPGVSTMHSLPVYVYHDPNQISPADVNPSINTALNYENMKVKSTTRLWSVYYRMRRNIRTPAGEDQTVNTRGYYNTSDPTSTQCIVITIPVLLNANGVVGNVIVTRYVTAFDRS